MGDPICDRFYLQLYENASLVALADGCNWGMKPREAAMLASNELITYISAHLHCFKDTRGVALALLKAFMRAHQKIIEPKEDPEEAGTTTLIGGLVMEINAGQYQDALRDKWAFVCAAVGDSKAILYSARTHNFYDITQGKRQTLSDVTDCGGRLGPSLAGAKADLRNLSLSVTLADEGDVILLLSDGVHDNLDPQMLGVSPSELGLDAKDWKEAVSLDTLSSFHLLPLSLFLLSVRFVLLLTFTFDFVFSSSLLFFSFLSFLGQTG
jgi:serine/threonine protein phosphatase PrpC